MTPKDILDKTKTQMMNGNKTTGIDVLIWLGRHTTQFMVFFSILAVAGGITWTMYLKPQVVAVAKELDAPIILQVNTNGKLVRQAYYEGRVTASIIKKTAPKNIVKEAEEEIEVEKLKPGNP